MAFNKDEYWKRRNNIVEVKDEKGKVTSTISKPLRGQGDPYRPTTMRSFNPKDKEDSKHMGMTLVRTEKGITTVNRATARRKQPSDPQFTKKQGRK